MSTSQSAPNSQSIPDVNSQPSSTPELQSAPTATGTNSNSSPDPEPRVIEISNDVAKAEEPVGKMLKSEAWLHFDKVKIDGVVKAVCKYCKAKLRGDSGCGTSHLLSHFRTKHHNKGQNSIRQQLLASNFNKEHPELASYNFSHDRAKKELAKMIIMHEYPISIVEHIGFRRYSSYLQPLFKVPCRKTIKTEIFHIYEFERAKTISILESNISRVAITSDMWTASNQKKGYMAIIDDSWHIKNIIMRFIYVPCPYTKDVLCDQIFECLMDWNLDRKISCLTLDNCSTNDAMIQLLLEKLDSSKLIAGGSLFHMRCAAHILNLIVKDGLDVMKVGLEKIRDSVAYWTATPKREEKFEETARQLRNTNSKKLGLDCATRWNSTYLMLETAFLYKDVFGRLAQKYFHQYKCHPSKEEWEFAEEVCSRLKFFYKATEVFSGTKYPTANCCFINICEIRLAITEWRRSSNFMIMTMAEKMLIKFDKYWEVMHGVVGVAAVLDPRYKMEVLEFYFEKIFGDSAASKIDNVRDLCYSLLKEYHQRIVVDAECNGDSCATGSSSIPNSESASQYDLFISTKKRKRVDSIKAELDHYLDEDVVQKSDVLTWWKVNELKYPTLQLMARDFLVVPAS